MSSEEFVHSVKDEVLNNNIYVFTPKGDVFELPKGSTPIDFAYKVHTKVGETMVGAIVNNNIVPLNYELKNNDIVKINTNKNSTPSKEWLNIVKATQTKNKIKSYFSKNERELYIEKGKYALEKELRRRKLTFSEFFTEENISKICKTNKLKDLDEIYLSVGNGKCATNSIINIIDRYKEIPVPKVVKISSKQIDADIIVAGIDKVKVNLANCCNPVFGDEIIGYITKGNGISVHRANCHNLAMLDNRTVSVSWNEETTKEKRYLSLILIYTNIQDNKMAELVQKTSLMNISIDSIKAITKPDEMTYELAIYIRDIDQLEKLIVELNKQSYIYKIERVMR
jgi:GTP pyrophosphokinase